MYKKVIFIFVFILFSSVTLSFYLMSNANANTQSDIKEHWAKEYIEEVLDKKLLSYCNDGLFKPDKDITRGELAYMLVKSLNFNIPSNIKPDFQDLSQIPDDIIPYVYFADKIGCMPRFEDNTFRAEKNISRQDIAVILSKFFGLEKNGGDNIEPSDTNKIASNSYEHVIKTLQWQILSLFPDNTFKPDALVSRAEACAAFVKGTKTIPLLKGKSIKFIVHYSREDSDFSQWNLKTWICRNSPRFVEFSNLPTGEGVAETEFDSVKGTTLIGFSIVKIDQENNISIEDSSCEHFVPIINANNGIIEIFVEQGSTTFNYGNN